MTLKSLAADSLALFEDLEEEWTDAYRLSELDNDADGIQFWGEKLAALHNAQERMRRVWSTGVEDTQGEEVGQV